MACINPMLSALENNYRAWNEHLIRCNNMFEKEGIPVRVNENDTRNRDVGFSFMPKDGVNYYSITKTCMDCDEVIETHKRLLNLTQRFNKESDVYHFGTSAIFVSPTVYFEIDKSIVFVDKLLLSEGHHWLAEG